MFFLDTITLIASVGEDSYLCLWTTTGELIYKKKINFGATIWNLDYCNKTKTIFTCGSDGNIQKICISRFLQDRNHENLKSEINLFGLKDTEYISKIRILPDQNLIGLTNLNRFIYQNNLSWIEIESNLKVCFIETYSNQIILGGFEKLLIYNYFNNQVNLLNEILIPDSMIRSFHLLNDEKSICCDQKGNCLIFDKNFKILYKLQIPNCKERWTTTGILVENFILLGDRCGNLHLYELIDDNVEWRNTLKTVHGTLGITHLCLIESNSNNFQIQSSGHDGMLKLIEINQKSFTISINNRIKTDILWIEKFYDQNDCVIGFNDNHFIIWSRLNGIINEIDCGGGHRYWDIFINFLKNECRFIYIRNKKIYQLKFLLKDISKNQIEIPSLNFHTSSCNTLIDFQMQNLNFIVSGGDDNILKIFSLNELSEIKLLYDVFSHISNIRCIELIKLNENELLIISAGGRAQICLTKCLLYKNKLTIQEVSNFMLKSSDFERKRLGKNREIDFDPETRFMSIAIYDKTKIYVSCSDGYIREFLINSSNYEIKLNKSIYYGRCILNIAIISNILITMSTNGLINFWNQLILSESSIPFYNLKHHESGINSFDIINDKLIYKIVTGGDDQNITITKFKIENNQIEIIETIKSNSIHTAQVTGCKFIDFNMIYSTGVDQTLNFINSDLLEAKDVKFSTVSDVKGLKFIKNLNKLFIYGSGFEILSI